MSLPAPLSSEAVAHLRAYLTAHWQTPEQYIVGVFKTRDVLLLAEDHCIRHNLDLVHALIPWLYRAGVYNLGMEFGASEDQAVLDQFVTGERYDEDIARRLMFNYNVGWAFKEYLDVYRTVWAFNRTLADSARKFRILNLSYKYDWAKAPPVRTPENARQLRVKAERGDFHVVMPGHAQAAHHDGHRADELEREIRARRVLIEDGRHPELRPRQNGPVLV